MCAVRMLVVDIKTREILQRIYVTLRGTEQMALLGPGRVPNVGCTAACAGTHAAEMANSRPGRHPSSAASPGTPQSQR